MFFSLASSISCIVIFVWTQVLAPDLRHLSTSTPLPTLTISSFLFLWSWNWELISTRITIKKAFSKILPFPCSIPNMHIHLFSTVKESSTFWYYLNVWNITVRTFSNIFWILTNYRSSDPLRLTPKVHCLHSLLYTIKYSPDSKAKWRAVICSNSGFKKKNQKNKQTKKQLCVGFIEKWCADLHTQTIMKGFSRRC